MPQTMKLQHEIAIRGNTKQVLEAVTTKRGLLGWNTSKVAGEGDVGTEWTLSYTGGPNFAWRVDRVYDRGTLWTCTRGPGDSVGTTTEFVLDRLPDGRTRLLLTHAGWPHTDGNYTKCNTLWGGLLHHLKKYVESGKPEPAHT